MVDDGLESKLMHAGLLWLVADQVQRLGEPRQRTQGVPFLQQPGAIGDVEPHQSVIALRGARYPPAHSYQRAGSFSKHLRQMVSKSRGTAGFNPRGSGDPVQKTFCSVGATRAAIVFSEPSSLSSVSPLTLPD